MKLTIRNATVNDLHAIVELTIDVQRLHAEIHPEVFKVPEHADASSAISFFLTKDAFHILLAEHEERIVGYAVCEIRQKQESALKISRRSTYIHQMAILSGYRRKGIGKAILTHIQQVSRELGITRIELDFWSANTEARAFYKAVGFVPLRETVEMISD